MSELFLTVLNMNLTASYVIIFVMLIRLPLKKAPKFISYALWGVVAFRLIIPFSFESIFSLMPRNTNSVPIPHDIIYQQSPQINSGIEAVDSFVSQSLPAPTVGASVNPLQFYVELAAYLWVLGIIALLVYSLVSILILKRQLKSVQLIEKNIFEANNLKTPFVLGLIRPKIYLPVGLNVDERSYILLHEQTHIHRKDNIIKIVAFLILCIHWFNPLVWIAFMLMSMDMELSCDERVLKEMDKDIKKPYANSLLSLATGRHILNGSPLAFGEGNAKGRVKNVLNYKKPRFWVVLASTIVLICVGIALLSNPTESEQDLSFLKPNNMLSLIGDQEQVKIVSTDYGNTSVSGRDLAMWLDVAGNNWKRINISSPYKFLPSITIHVNDETGNEIRFYESEPTLVMTLYQNEYQYYKIPEEDYTTMAAMVGAGYPHVQSTPFTEHEDGNDNASVPAMPGGLPKVYPENDEFNKAFINAKLLPEVYWETNNKTNLPQEGATVSIPSGRLVFAFLPTRPREVKPIFIDEATLKQIISEIAVAKVLPKPSRIDWAQADFQDYWLNLYVLTDGKAYNRIELWGPIRHKKDVYVDISVRSVGSTYAFETWRIESSALSQILIDTWGPKFDLQRFQDVTRIDMRVLNFYSTTKVGNKATLQGNAAKDMAERMLKTSKVVTGYGKCGYNIELSFTFADGTTELGWLNGDSCPGIAMDNGPNIMFDKEITRELYKLLDYGEGFISD
jgi:beta-lactamase regulating signal transducer with metallopeptidase domain